MQYTFYAFKAVNLRFGKRVHTMFNFCTKSPLKKYKKKSHLKNTNTWPFLSPWLQNTWQFETTTENFTRQELTMVFSHPTSVLLNR